MSHKPGLGSLGLFSSLFELGLASLRKMAPSLDHSQPHVMTISDDKDLLILYEVSH
jgi:hypothetical protein